MRFWKKKKVEDWTEIDPEIVWPVSLDFPGYPEMNGEWNDPLDLLRSVEFWNSDDPEFEDELIIRDANGRVLDGCTDMCQRVPVKLKFARTEGPE